MHLSKFVVCSSSKVSKNLWMGKNSHIDDPLLEKLFKKRNQYL